MGVFEAQLIALAEAMAEQVLAHLMAKLGAKLGVSLPELPVQTPQAVE